IIDDEPVIVDENGYFVKNGNSDYIIVVPDEANDTETYTAAELRRYISVSTGANLPVTTDAGRTYNENDKVISIGKTVYQKNADLRDIDYNELKTGGYFIKSFGNLYLLDSGVREGVLYSGYEFLRTFFGIEFLTNDDTYIPESTEVKSYKIDYKTVPAFPIRDYYSYHVWYHSAAYGAKLNMNSTSFKASASVNGENSYAYYGYYYEYNDQIGFVQREGHTIAALLAADAYVNGYTNSPAEKVTEGGAHPNLPVGYLYQHPEWYAMDLTNGRAATGGVGRGRLQEEICYSNGLDSDWRYVKQSDNTAFKDLSVTTKMIQIIKRMILNEPSQEAVYLMLGHSDGADVPMKCTCDRCKQAYAKFGGFGGFTIVWGNEVIKQIKPWMRENNIDRELKIVMFAYDKSLEPPVTWDSAGNPHPVNDRVVPDEDIIIKMAYRNCVYHSLWDEECEQNEILRKYFKGWTSIASGFAIWDYSCVFDDYLWYLPNFGTIKDNYIYYTQINVQHLLSQGMPGEYNCYEHSLHMWVSCKLMWNPYQDVNALIKKFNSLYFGKYAEYVDAYRDIIENHFAILDANDENGFHASTGSSLDFKSASKYPLAMLSRMSDIIQEAIDLVKVDSELTDDQKEMYEKKLRSVKITPQYMMLKLNLIMDDTIKKSVATDFFDSISALRLTYMREGNLVANSFDEMKKAYGL
ncbi:MAG: DUF4838 domain-containing protein, partial [Clostridia bacterium]|nr:DUF4838 domain-containing protein [Clostridia bacterium]